MRDEIFGELVQVVVRTKEAFLGGKIGGIYSKDWDGQHHCIACL